MRFSKSFSTILNKYIVLLCNFILVLYSTYLWGSEGRGTIALIITNISFVNILTNITSGSTLAFYASKKTRATVMSINVAGALFLSLFGVVMICIFFGWEDFINYLSLCVLISLTNSIAMYYLGVGDLKKYNILLVLNSLTTVLSLSLIVLCIENPSLEFYFYALYVGLGISLLMGICFLYYDRKSSEVENGSVKNDFKEIVAYGFKNEVSYFFQFLCYRFSYFIIAKEMGVSALGVFSVAVALVESVWVISRSIATVHFAEVINNATQQNENIAATKKRALQSLAISALLSFVIVFVPNELFGWVFGKDFTGIRIILLYLIPGCMAIAFSDLYGHYFAAIGNQKILIEKSILGLVIVMVAMYALIPSYKLEGVCIAINVAYIVQSLYLVYFFNRKEKEITV